MPSHCTTAAWSTVHLPPPMLKDPTLDLLYEAKGGEARSLSSTKQGWPMQATTPEDRAPRSLPASTEPAPPLITALALSFPPPLATLEASLLVSSQLHRILHGKSNSTFAAITAAVTANVVLVAYIASSLHDDQAERKGGKAAKPLESQKYH
ncbi:hypothetical protein DFH94DRAFT_811479 [Russula ochroleuca]|uniref:Uncharacterized protein n=1 Tax=Russula ochroleuca TaxID=152965 RepID=A0A9P5JZH9_9AGAM|nr:hypothetical protein DFH94DRAFT_811479 [Russula ochroleuca]